MVLNAAGPGSPNPFRPGAFPMFFITILGQTRNVATFKPFSSWLMMLFATFSHLQHESHKDRKMVRGMFCIGNDLQGPPKLRLPHDFQHIAPLQIKRQKSPNLYRTAQHSAASQPFLFSPRHWRMEMMEQSLDKPSRSRCFLVWKLLALPIAPQEGLRQETSNASFTVDFQTFIWRILVSVPC